MRQVISNTKDNLAMTTPFFTDGNNSLEHHIDPLSLTSLMVPNTRWSKDESVRNPSVLEGWLMGNLFDLFLVTVLFVFFMLSLVTWNCHGETSRQFMIVIRI